LTRQKMYLKGRRQAGQNSSNANFMNFMLILSCLIVGTDDSGDTPLSSPNGSSREGRIQ
jgi:hypothetical protein